MSQYSELRPSYEAMHNGCVKIADNIRAGGFGIKKIVGVIRGGMVPAVIISHMLDNVPIVAADYSSKSGQGDDKNHTNILPVLTAADGPILVVDDICDSGKTLNEIVYHYSKLGVVVYTAVLFYKTHDKQPMVPDFWWRAISHNSGWIDFPYERNELLSGDTEAATSYFQSMVRS